LKNPFVPNEKVVGFFNLDGVGRGKRISGTAGKNYPRLWKYIEEANRQYVHRELIASNFNNRARPRLDAARFISAGIPSVSFSAGGADPLPYPTYHRTTDIPEILTPEIMEDLARLLLIALLRISNS
jgi:Zn-dependent M28 family amino/carboxypeptidase